MPSPREQFERAVRAHEFSRGAPEWAIEAAVNIHLRARDLDLSPRGVEKCAEVARAIYVSFSERPDKGTGTVAKSAKAAAPPGFSIAITPALLAERHRLAAFMRPRVERIRRTLFEIPAPPFPGDLGATARWIEAEATRQAQPPDDAPTQAMPLLDEADRLGREGARLLDGTFSYTLAQCTLVYAKPSDTKTGLGAVNVYRLDPVEVPPPPLWSLESDSRALAEAYGLSPVAVVAFILAGVEPLFRPVEVRRVSIPRPVFAEDHDPRIGLPTRPEITVTVRAPLTFDELRAVHRGIEANLGLSRPTGVTATRTHTWDVVARLGGLPKADHAMSVTAFFRERVCPEICGPGFKPRRNHWRTHYTRFREEQARREAVSSSSAPPRRPSGPRGQARSTRPARAEGLPRSTPEHRVRRHPRPSSKTDARRGGA